MHTNSSTTGALFGLTADLDESFKLQSVQQPVLRKKRVLTKDAWEQKKAERARRDMERFIADAKLNPTGMLFDELMDFLSRPLLDKKAFAELAPHTDKVSVLYSEETGNEVDPLVEPDIPYEPWGAPWIIDKNGFSWSREAIGVLQHIIYWESLWEFALNNNQPEKWSVLKWIFQPAVRKMYAFNQKLQRSICLDVHERDLPFSYHNCSIAVRISEDGIREGVRKNMPSDLIEAVERVCTYR